MDIEWIRQHCLALPHTTETYQWGGLVFKIGGKIFAVLSLEPGDVFLSFKCAPETFADLIERDGIVPAPYLARAQWVALERENALPPAEIKSLLREAYNLILAKLPKKAQAALAASPKRKGRRA